MKAVLSQDEVDALLQGITSDGDKPESEETTGSGPRGYDLAGDERIVRARMPMLELVNERFARNLRAGLFELIRRSAEISIGSVKAHKYSAFLREIVVPTNFNIVSLRPLRGAGLIVCEPTLIFAIIDALFGGNGKYPTRIEGREFSPTEQRIIERLLGIVLCAYGSAWQGIYPLHFEHQASQMQPQFVNIAAPGEMVVSCSFTLELGETSGAVHICLPYAALEPIREVLCSSMHGETGEPDRRWVELMKNQIRDADVELVAELAHAPATVEQLLSLKAGDFIEFDLRKVIEATVNGVPLFDCQYGTSNGKYSLKFEQWLGGSEGGWLQQAG